jgi:hypothetical protein
MSNSNCLDRLLRHQHTIPIIFRTLYDDGDGWCGLHERTEFWSFLGGPEEQVERLIRDGMGWDGMGWSENVCGRLINREESFLNRPGRSVERYVTFTIAKTYTSRPESSPPKYSTLLMLKLSSCMVLYLYTRCAQCKFGCVESCRVMYMARPICMVVVNEAGLRTALGPSALSGGGDWTT